MKSAQGELATTAAEFAPFQAGNTTLTLVATGPGAVIELVTEAENASLPPGVTGHDLAPNISWDSGTYTLTGDLIGVDQQFTFRVTTREAGKEDTVVYRQILLAPIWPGNGDYGLMALSEEDISYSQQIERPPEIAGQVLQFSVDNRLPPGIVFDDASVSVSGTPTDPGTYRFTVTATVMVEGQPGAASSRDFVIVVGLPGPAWITPAGLLLLTEDGTPYQGTTYSKQLDVAITTEEPGAYLEFTLVSGAFPAGISMNTDGLLSGTGTANGDFDVTVQAALYAPESDPVSETRAFTVRVGADPVWTSAASATAKRGTYFSTDLAATNAIRYDASPLPPGLQVSESGGAWNISGYPTSHGNFSFTVTAYNEGDSFVQRSSAVTMTMTITEPDINITRGPYGRGFTTAITRSGQNPWWTQSDVFDDMRGWANNARTYDPLVYSLVSAPDGIYMDGNGKIKGVPTGFRTFEGLTLRATSTQDPSKYLDYVLGGSLMVLRSTYAYRLTEGQMYESNDTSTGWAADTVQFYVVDAIRGSRPVTVGELPETFSFSWETSGGNSNQKVEFDFGFGKASNITDTIPMIHWSNFSHWTSAVATYENGSDYGVAHGHSSSRRLAIPEMTSNQPIRGPGSYTVSYNVRSGAFSITKHGVATAYATLEKYDTSLLVFRRSGLVRMWGSQVRLTGLGGFSNAM